MYKNLGAYRNLPARLLIPVSGGRSSAYLLAHIIEANGGLKPQWVCCFQNTGLEDEATLRFLDRLDRHFCVKLVYLEFDPTINVQFKKTTNALASREGQPFSALLTQTIAKRRDGTAGVRPLPNPVQRVCTTNLKVKTSHRYLRASLGWPTEYHTALGFRADENKRVERRAKMDNQRSAPQGGRGVYPMHTAGVSQDDVQSFWQAMPFDLEIDSARGNCDFCFMLSTWKIKERMLLCALEQQIKPVLVGPIPERVSRWIAWEERKSDRPGVFRRDRPTYRQLWTQVCAGNMASAVAEGRNDQCGNCSD